MNLDIKVIKSNDHIKDETLRSDIRDTQKEIQEYDKALKRLKDRIAAREAFVDHLSQILDYRKRMLLLKGKCPEDGRIRPVFIIRNNKREMVTSGGDSNAYKRYSTGYSHDDIPKLENLIDPATYEFDSGLTGLDS